MPLISGCDFKIEHLSGNSFLSMLCSPCPLNFWLSQCSDCSCYEMYSDRKQTWSQGKKKIATFLLLLVNTIGKVPKTASHRWNTTNILYAENSQLKITSFLTFFS